MTFNQFRRAFVRQHPMSRRPLFVRIDHQWWCLIVPVVGTQNNEFYRGKTEAECLKGYYDAH